MRNEHFMRNKVHYHNLMGFCEWGVIRLQVLGDVVIAKAI